MKTHIRYYCLILLAFSVNVCVNKTFAQSKNLIGFGFSKINYSNNWEQGAPYKIAIEKIGNVYELNFQHFLKNKNLFLSYSLNYSSLDFSIENYYLSRYSPPIYYYPSPVYISDKTTYFDKYLVNAFSFNYIGKGLVTPFIGAGIDIRSTFLCKYNNVKNLEYFTYNSSTNYFRTDSIIQIPQYSGKDSYLISSLLLNTVCGISTYLFNGISINLNVFYKYYLYKKIYSWKFNDITNSCFGFGASLHYNINNHKVAKSK